VTSTKVITNISCREWWFDTDDCSQTDELSGASQGSMCILNMSRDSVLTNESRAFLPIVQQYRLSTKYDCTHKILQLILRKNRLWHLADISEVSTCWPRSQSLWDQLTPWPGLPVPLKTIGVNMTHTCKYQQLFTKQHISKLGKMCNFIKMTLIVSFFFAMHLSSQLLLL